MFSCVSLSLSFVYIFCIFRTRYVGSLLLASAFLPVVSPCDFGPEHAVAFSSAEELCWALCIRLISIPYPPADWHSLLQWGHVRQLTLTILFRFSGLSRSCHLFPCCCFHSQRCLDLFYLLSIWAVELDSSCVRGRRDYLVSLRQKFCVFLLPTFLCCCRSFIHPNMAALDVLELFILWT